MNSIIVKIQKSSFECSKNQLITGVIFFDFMDVQFPRKDWNDFVVIILNWWLSALTKISLGFSKSENLQFMDGPLFVSVKKIDNGICMIECADERKGGYLEFSGQYQLNEVLSSVLQVAKDTYRICCENRWDGDDLDELKRGINNFSDLIRVN